MGFTAGCSKKPAKSPKKNSDLQKTRQTFLQFQMNIDKLIKEYETEFLKQVAPAPKPSQQEMQKSQAGTKSQAKGEQQSKDKKGEQSQATQGQQESKEGQQGKGPDWPKFEKMVAQLHAQWNTIQPNIVTQGATPEMQKSFSNTLNELTMTITRQELFSGLIAANDLYNKSISFERLLKMKSSTEAKKILYHGRDAVYKALNNQETAGEKSIEKAMRSWEIVKHQIKDQNMINKFEFSLTELDEAIKHKDPNLIKIKAQIAGKNIQEIIRTLEKEQQ